VWIADFVLQRFTGSSGNLQERPVIPLQEDEKLRASFQLRRPLLIAMGERRRYGRVQPRNDPFERRLNLREFFCRFLS
jgi:hypothetical protein